MTPVEQRSRLNGPATGRSAAEPRRPHWATDGLVAVALLWLPFVVFWAETIGQAAWYYHDVQYYFLPYHKLVSDLVQQGQLPLWNPYAFSGIPLLGDGQTAMFYPPNWLFFLLPATQAFSYVVLLQFGLAGLGMWSFSRGLRLARGPAAFAALSFMFSGFLTTRVVHLSIMSGAALIPLLFWAVDRLLARPTPRRWAVAAVAIGLQAVAGHPQVPVYTAFALGIYTLVVTGQHAVATRRLRPLLGLLQLGGVYGLGYALAAIQLLPWFEFASVSPRAAGASYEFVTYHSINPQDWWLWLFPYGFGGVRTSWFELAQPNIGRAIGIWEHSAYVGLAPLALALIGLVALFWPAVVRQAPLDQRRRWRAVWAVGLAGGLIAVGYNTPVGQLVYALPVLGKLRAYSRAVVLLSFAVSAGAGWGLQVVISSAPAIWRRLRWLSGGIMATLLLLTGGAVLLASVPTLLPGALPAAIRAHVPWQRPNGWLPLLLATLTMLLLPLLRRRWGWWSLVALTVVDLGTYAVTFNPTLPPADFAATPRSVQFLAADPTLYRTAAFITNDTLLPATAQSQLALSWSMAYGISSINGFNSLQPRRYTDVLFGPTVEDVSYGFLGDPSLLQPGQQLLNLLNVKYVLLQPGSKLQPGRPYEQVYLDPSVSIYRNTAVWERAFFVDQVQPATAARALQAMRPAGTALRQRAYVEGLDEATAQTLRHSPGAASVTVRQPRADTLELATSTTERRLLVVSEPFFAGWEATIDGRPTPIYRTDYLLRGVIVPPGSHTIRMVYRPWSVRWGAGISAVVALLLLGLATRPGRPGELATEQPADQGRASLPVEQAAVERQLEPGPEPAEPHR